MYEDALPAVRTATYDAIEEIAATLPEGLQVDARKLLRWLCDPEPRSAWASDYESAIYGRRVRLVPERIISAADLLATKARILGK